MAVLSRITHVAPMVGMLATASCYAPELRDCAVSCTAEADCGPGQVCGADAWCAAPPLAGQCGALTLVDAGPASGSDARRDAAPVVPDATVPPSDAPDAPSFTLTVRIAGRGRVIVEGGGQCDHTAPAHTCTFAVPPAVELTLMASPLPDTRFDRWNAGACLGQDETCQLTPLLLTTFVEAKFRNGSDDDD